jgi:UDP-glucose 4-epimerase
VATGVRHLTVTSSGAAYGYHADNPDWIDEQQPLRGNDSFSYSRHKRLVEELMAEYRQQHPQLAQLVFRPGTVVGAETANMITRLFSGRFVLGLRGCRSPFVFIWDQDLVDLLADGVARSVTGIYNVAGDGAVTLREIGEILGKPVLEVPIWFLKVVLSITKPLRITRYGPDQIMFMQYRPVLSNHKLRTEFGHRLKKSSREAFEYFARHVKE